MQTPSLDPHLHGPHLQVRPLVVVRRHTEGINAPCSPSTLTLDHTPFLSVGCATPAQGALCPSQIVGRSGGRGDVLEAPQDSHLVISSDDLKG